MLSVFENLARRLQQEPQIGVFSYFQRMGIRLISTPRTRIEEDAQRTQFNKEQGARQLSWLDEVKYLPRIRLP